MAWPLNSNVNTGIVQDDFFSSVEKAQNARFYPRLSTPKTTDEIVTTFASFGSVPEIRQMSGVEGGGPRQAALLKDYTVSATMYEFEQTVYLRRLLAQSKPEVVRSKTTQIASKAMKGMDRTLCQALVSSTALGYDGKALLSTTHAESGSNQSNTLTGANITTNYIPTAAEAETMLSSQVAAIKAFTDDQGTPVNEGASRFILLCPIPMYLPFKRVVDPNMSNLAVDSSGGTGVFRGMIEVIASAYATTTGLTSGTQSMTFMFTVPEDVDSSALALATLADWQFNTNFGDESSDDWNKGECFLRSWAAFAFVPWQWSSVCAITVS